MSSSQTNLTLAALNLTNAALNTSYIDKSTKQWFVPRIWRSFSKAVEQQSKAPLPDRRANLSFGYLISPYAGACMTMAIILNRTVVFASSRRNTNRFSTVPKVTLRIISIAVLTKALWEIFIQFTITNTSLKKVVSGLISDEVPDIRAFLWRIFTSLCISQLLETFVSITSNQSALNDTGLTLFEHSLAFQECQSLSEPSSQLITICLFSVVNQLVIHILGITNQKKYQLIPSTILGVSFLVFYCYNIYTGGLIFFPTVVILSVIPQFLVFSIIFLCLVIYYAAVLVNQDSSNLTYTTMVQNLKSSINLQMNDDFHSTLMRFGNIMFNAVENEEYINELSDVTLPKETYLESSGHLVSGYLNNIQTNPELLPDEDKESSQNETQFKNSSVGKRTAACFKLIWKIFGLAFRRRKNFRPSIESSNETTQTSLLTHDINSDITETNYKVFLSNDSQFLLPGNDTSDDFSYESESDIDPLDFDSEAEDFEELDTPGYLSSAAMARLYDSGAMVNSSSRQTTETTPKLRFKAIDELINSSELINLITPTDIEQVSFLNSLRTHLLQDKRLTRRSYSEINQDELLREVILRNRDHDHTNDHHHDEYRELACVVCQTNQREIIVWPCKCFALCENCRVSLGVRGFSICVCCRRKVDGYSKIYIP